MKDAIGKKKASLEKFYHEASDEELLILLHDSHSLTGMAQEILTYELERRNISRALPNVENPHDDSERSGNEDEAKSLEETVVLATFVDPTSFYQACGHLESHGIPFEIEDRTPYLPKIKLRFGAPTVMVDLRVQVMDLTRAAELLRLKMGLFVAPAQNSAASTEDDEVILPVGFYSEECAAETASRILSRSKILHRVTDATNSRVVSSERYVVEVRERDLIVAGDALARELSEE